MWVLGKWVSKYKVKSCKTERIIDKSKIRVGDVQHFFLSNSENYD